MARKSENLNGQRFGMLTVENITEQRNNYGRLLYKCICDCGNEKLATSANLKRGEVTCCGCKYTKVKKDLTGQRFGRLIAINPIKSTGARRSYNWECECDCGNKIVVSGNDLLSDNTSSCGCAKVDNMKKLYKDNTAPCKLVESKHPRKTNISGVTGVWLDKTRNLWTAEITFKRKKIFLGRFIKKEDAVKARKNAEKEYFDAYLNEQSEIKS